MKSVIKRQLKIQEKYFPRDRSRYVAFPEIKLCGKWLHDMGFYCGEIITISCEQYKLVITVNSNMHCENKEPEGKIQPEEETR